MIGIYCIKNVVNNKLYIGQSIDIKQRWKKHKSELKRGVHNNKHLQGSWNYYKEEAFEFIVLEECTEEHLDELEIKYIKLYNATDPRFGYCDMVGGQKHRHHSEATRKKCGAKNVGRKLKPDIIKMLQDINTGRPLSEEHKRKISESNKGKKKPHKGNNQKTVICINTGEIFKSIRDATKWCGLKSESKISECAKGKYNYAGKHPETNEKLRWEFA